MLAYSRYESSEPAWEPPDKFQNETGDKNKFYFLNVGSSKRQALDSVGCGVPLALDTHPKRHLRCINHLDPVPFVALASASGGCCFSWCESCCVPEGHYEHAGSLVWFMSTASPESPRSWRTVRHPRWTALRRAVNPFGAFACHPMDAYVTFLRRVQTTAATSS